MRWKRYAIQPFRNVSQWNVASFCCSIMKCNDVIVKYVMLYTVVWRHSFWIWSTSFYSCSNWADILFRSFVAGTVAGLSVLALDDSSRRRTFALYLLARVAQVYMIFCWISCLVGLKCMWIVNEMQPSLFEGSARWMVFFKVHMLEDMWRFSLQCDIPSEDIFICILGNLPCAVCVQFCEG